MALAFGTGGLRGLLGEDENELNEQTIARATHGVAAYLLSTMPERAKTKGVAIAFDTRHYSQAFALMTAAVFESRGIPAHLFTEPTPTPVLSFAVLHLGCAGGIVITASHNPKEYNGYKVYNAQGYQLVPDEAEAVIRHIDEAEDAALPPVGSYRAIGMEVELAYLNAVLSQSLLADAAGKESLHIVYTPLHGTGMRFVPRALHMAGFSNVQLVGPQTVMDGSFPTVKSPNPEDRDALNMAIEQAMASGAELIIGTDPDCDRVGAAVLHGGSYRLISGNQMGALLLDYILSQDKHLPARGAVIKTIVTNDLGAVLARKAGMTVYETLTGFKYIGEKIWQFEQKKTDTFVFGYEESYGYLRGTYARDKDAVVSSMLIAEMAALHKHEGRTLVDALENLFRKHGVYLDALETIDVDDIEQTEAIMERLRQGGGALFSPPAEMLDYTAGLGDLPPSDVLKFRWPHGAWLAVRPSGTEPKLKIYYATTGENRKIAEEMMDMLREQASGIIRA